MHIVTGEEKIFRPNPARDWTWVVWVEIRHSTIKAGLLSKAVQVLLYTYTQWHTENKKVRISKFLNFLLNPTYLNITYNDWRNSNSFNNVSRAFDYIFVIVLFKHYRN